MFMFLKIYIRIQIKFKPLKFIMNRFTLIKANKTKHELMSHFSKDLLY